MHSSSPAAERVEESPELLLGGRFEVIERLASGGMGTVWVARAIGVPAPPRGAGADFHGIVALKQPHPHLVAEHEFSSMFLDEARIASRVVHPNVARMFEILAPAQGLLLVMEYVHGVPLTQLLKASAGSGLPGPIASAILVPVLEGLHAAHEARSPAGAPLNIVHRDVSPQNILVAEDGTPKIVDFGVAKAVGRLQSTGDGKLKGKLAYMAPEQLREGEVDRRADVYTASILLWEMLAGRSLFGASSQAGTLERALIGCRYPPSRHVYSVSAELDDLVLRGLSRDPARRFATALEMAEALRRAAPPAPSAEVAAWVARASADLLSARRHRIAQAVAAAHARPRTPAHSEIRGPSSRSRALTLGVGATLLLGLAAGLAWLSRGRGAEVERDDRVAHTASSPSAAAPSPPPVEPTVAAPVLLSSGRAEVEPAPPSGRVRAVRAAPPRPAAGGAAASGGAADCAVPYRVNADGKREYKRECL